MLITQLFGLEIHHTDKKQCFFTVQDSSLFHYEPNILRISVSTSNNKYRSTVQIISSCNLINEALYILISLYKYEYVV